MDSIAINICRDNPDKVLVLSNNPEDPEILRLIEATITFLQLMMEEKEEKEKKDNTELPDNVTRIH